jgi:hypothetical protein
MVPETAASWVCDHAPTENNVANAAASMHGRYHRRERRRRNSSVQRIDSKDGAHCGIDASAGKSSRGPVDKVPPPCHTNSIRASDRHALYPDFFDIFPLRAITCHHQRKSLKARGFSRNAGSIRRLCLAGSCGSHFSYLLRFQGVSRGACLALVTRRIRLRRAAWRSSRKSRQISFASRSSLSWAICSSLVKTTSPCFSRNARGDPRSRIKAHQRFRVAPHQLQPFRVR